jgi:hypothetical protein
MKRERMAVLELCLRDHVTDEPGSAVVETEVRVTREAT